MDPFAVIIGVSGVAIAIGREVYARRRERPRVIANEVRNRHLVDDVRGGWAVEANLENIGSEDAFNLRFGVELNGVRFPWRASPDDEIGSRINALAAREKTTNMLVRLPETFNFSGGGDPGPGRRYWCRYESTNGSTWETSNPWERQGRNTIRRVRFPRRREADEKAAREKNAREGQTGLEKARDELVAGMDAGSGDDT